MQPVRAVNLVLLVHAEVEPVLEQPDTVGADDGHRNAVGVGRNGIDGGAVVLRPDRIQISARDFAAEIGKRLDCASVTSWTERVVLADEGTLRNPRSL